MINIRRVLVATDFSEIADGALDYGRALAEHFGGTLHVLHVADVLQPIAVGVEGYFADVSDLQREVDEAARQQLDACLARKGISAGITVPVVLTSPMVAQTIVDYASEQQIDVVVVGTHGRGGHGQRRRTGGAHGGMPGADGSWPGTGAPCDQAPDGGSD